MDPRDPQQIVLAAAALGAVIYLGQKALRLAQAVLAIQNIVQRELEHNHGSSMKDDVYGMAIALGRAARRLDEFEEALRRQHPDDPLFRRH